MLECFYLVKYEYLGFQDIYMNWKAHVDEEMSALLDCLPK